MRTRRLQFILALLIVSCFAAGCGPNSTTNNPIDPGKSDSSTHLPPVGPPAGITLPDTSGVGPKAYAFFRINGESFMVEDSSCGQFGADFSYGVPLRGVLKLEFPANSKGVLGVTPWIGQVHVQLLNDGTNAMDSGYIYIAKSEPGLRYGSFEGVLRRGHPDSIVITDGRFYYRSGNLGFGSAKGYRKFEGDITDSAVVRYLDTAIHYKATVTRRHFSATNGDAVFNTPHTSLDANFSEFCGQSLGFDIPGTLPADHEFYYSFANTDTVLGQWQGNDFTSGHIHVDRDGNDLIGTMGFRASYSTGQINNDTVHTYYMTNGRFRVSLH